MNNNDTILSQLKTMPEVFLSWKAGNLTTEEIIKAMDSESEKESRELNEDELPHMNNKGWWEAYTAHMKNWYNRQWVYELCCHDLERHGKLHLMPYVRCAIQGYQRDELVREALHAGGGIIDKAEQLFNETL